MRKTIFLLSLAGLLVAPALASAQAVVELRLGLPVVLPQLVVVSPGIQVVPDIDEEVFFTSGFYWVRRDDFWYRSPDPRHGWVVVPVRGVPPGLARMPPGQYRHWHPGRPPGPAYRGGPVYRGGGPGPAYRGGPAPVYRGGPAPVYRGGGPVFRGGGEGEWKHHEGDHGEREWKHHDEGDHGEGHHEGGKRGRGKRD